MFYKLVKVVPYCVLLLVAIAFSLISLRVSNDLIKNIFIGIASNAVFVIIAYLFYDIIKAYIEFTFKNELNFKESLEKAIEFTCINAKALNPSNENGFLLLKKTQIQDRLVVYDSGKFDISKESKLLNRYIINADTAKIISDKIYELNIHLKYWIPKETYINKNNDFFRIVKDFFSPFTKISNIKTKIYIGDIVDMHKNDIN